MKACKLILMALVILISSGCARLKPDVSFKRDNIMDAYMDAVASGRKDVANYIKDNLKLTKTFGYVKPYVPVMRPPQVAMVWIPAHKSSNDAGALVGGHWVYLMVEPSKWFIDEESKQEARIPIIIPYKEDKK